MGTNFMFLELLFIFLVVLAGGFIQGASGFGFGLLAMSFLPLFLSIKESTLIVISLLLIASLNIIFKLYKQIEWKGLYLLLGSALIGRVLSFFVLTTYGDMEFLKKLLGSFLIAMVIYLLVKKDSSSQAVIKPSVPLMFGFLGGFIGGVFAIGGPFFVFYFMLLHH